MLAVKRRTTCRLCGARDLAPVLSLPPTPLANAFVAADHSDEDQPVFELDLVFCLACGHAQLRHVVSPFDLFQRNRSAIAGNPTNDERAEAFAAALLNRHRPPKGALVLEVGSNDGTLLKRFADEDYRVQGVEPAVDLARAAIAADVPTFPGFFGPGVAERLQDEHGSAELLIASGTLAHVDDLTGTVESLSRLLARDGLLAFEIPYLGDIVEGCQIDAIRHENLDYHSVERLVGLFHECDLEILSIERCPTQGGRLRGYAQHLGGPHASDGSVEAFRAHELSLGLAGGEPLRELGARIETLREDVTRAVSEARAQGQRVAGWGAPARATSLMAALGLGPDMLDFVIDEAPWKQGLLTPGTHVPIVAPDVLETERLDWLVLLAWDRADEVINRTSVFRERGGRYLVPLPTVRTF